MKQGTEELKQKIQLVIDLVAAKKYAEASENLSVASNMLDELLDHAGDDDDLIEISRYQVLLNHLQQTIANG